MVIGFPDPDAARAWYDSPAYQEILPLRTRNSTGHAGVDGVACGSTGRSPDGMTGGRRTIR